MRRREFHGFGDPRPRHPMIVYVAFAVIVAGLVIAGAYSLLGPDSVVGRPIRNAIETLADIFG